MSDIQSTRIADRSAFFDRLARNWSQAHYGPHGDMVARIARFTDALENLVPARASILDYGCGTGDIAAALAARGYRVEARDTSPTMIEEARRIHTGAGVHFADIEPAGAQADVRISDQAFDAVVCSSVLEYLHDLPESLRLLCGALKPGGCLLATVPNIDHPLRRREPIYRMLMGIAPLRSLIRLTPWRETFELQWLSHNRMAISGWIGFFHAAGLRPVWQDGQDHPLALLIGRKCL